MRKGWVLMGCLASIFLSVPTWASSPGSLDELVSGLTALRDNCSQKAQQAKSDFSMATFKEGLTEDADRQQATMDARVYAVGHGDRETTAYLANRLQENSANQAQRSKAISDKLAADKQAVQACILDARERGKANYSSFKADPKRKRYLSEAESLMTAWLTNVDEITTDQPEGSDISKANWNTAKSHAELQ
jgi:hypothetical protein